MLKYSLDQISYLKLVCFSPLSSPWLSPPHYLGLPLPSFSFSPVISFLDPATTSSPVSSPHLLTVWSQVGPAVARTEQGGRACIPTAAPASPYLTTEANSSTCNSQSPAPSSLKILFYAASQSLRPPWFSHTRFKTDSFKVSSASTSLLAQLTQSKTRSTIARLHFASGCKMQHFSAFCLKFLNIGHKG